MTITWNNLDFNKNPFFLDAIPSYEELKFFGDRKSETNDMLDKIKQESLPFVLEGDVGSGKTTLLIKVANELEGAFGVNLKENNCFLLVRLNCEAMNELAIKSDMKKYAFNELFKFVLAKERVGHLLEKITTTNAYELPSELFEGDYERKSN